MPETKVLEAKLTKMVKLEPAVEKAVESVNALTKLPTKEEIAKSESEIIASSNKIDAAVKNEKSETEKNGVKESPAEKAAEPEPVAVAQEKASNVQPAGNFIATNVQKKEDPAQ